ncbi:hypothetical protein E1B28_005765 [Marasmius oreades]|uniref:Uncharacterized protein n=1 Tax=Marasmius oreades TaxID=181124 RepID=A0A9P7S3X8_9AGAR|nr:uncharacterized protein E1B28_005765 [Marasmius oreades]KAG7094964.1 hypothetical protein E1B28_005765 [Marasmius oreades]
MYAYSFFNWSLWVPSRSWHTALIPFKCFYMSTAKCQNNQESCKITRRHRQSYIARGLGTRRLREVLRRKANSSSFPDVDTRYTYPNLKRVKDNFLPTKESSDLYISYVFGSENLTPSPTSALQ